MAEHLEDRPNPGSDEALAQGCRCPVMDNAHGLGFMGGVSDPASGHTVFILRGGCPLHWPDVLEGDHA